MADQQPQVSLAIAGLAEQHALTWSPCDPHAVIDSACALTPGRPGAITFAETEQQLPAVLETAAGAVIVTPALAALCVERAPAGHGAELLVSDAPRLMFARIASVFERGVEQAGVHESAIIHPTAEVHDSAHVSARACIGAHASLGARTQVGVGASVADGVVVGSDCRIGANVALLAGTTLGDRVWVEAGAVLGGRGFGLVAGPRGMEPVPQLGGVRIGNDVEIGANSTIDRGALEDTVIHDRVKIDNQVHIAHNCVIGEHTVIAGCSGIAGSCRIGARCLIGGGVGIGDHVNIVDDVVITAASQVPKHIDTPGVYSSTFRAMPARSWRKRLALFRALDRTDKRLRRLEQNN